MRVCVYVSEGKIIIKLKRLVKGLLANYVKHIGNFY